MKFKCECSSKCPWGDWQDKEYCAFYSDEEPPITDRPQECPRKEEIIL